jgi:signal transduction histidine kinase/DNA-binding NarL/FixJ family response regulator
MNVVLVIAEDRAIYEALQAALQETDLVLIEPTVDHALRRLIGVKADVVIVDDAPALGPRALARIAEAAPSTPILALSARSDAETLAGMALAGARSCLSKPFSYQELQAALGQLLRAPAPPRPPQTERREHRGLSPVVTQHQTALRWLSRTGSQIRDPERISQGLVDAVTDIFDPARSAVLLEEGGTTRVAASHGIAPAVAESLRLGFRSGLMRWFEQYSCLIDRDENRDPAAVKELHVMGARLGAPLVCGGRVVGAIVVGDKASGRDYTLEEHELITMVARCASVALENAQLYHNTHRQQNRLDTIVASMTSGVVVMGMDKNVSMVNQSAERLLQLRAVDVLGRSIQKLGSGFADVALRALRDGKPLLRQTVTEPAINGTLGLSATPMGSEGVVIIFSALPKDVASPKDIAYSPFWEYLSSRVAQEVKNPMVAINTFAQLLPRKYDSDDFRDSFSETVQTEVARINRVVETLFEFARRPRLMLQRSDVTETVQGILKSFEEELEARSIRVETEWTDGPLDADIDPALFAKAVQNVLQNSIDAMPSGGTLRVTTRGSEGGCEVRVADTGPGVSETDAPHIFNPFFSTREQGMGLGLTMANRIMDQHDGELELAANDGGGSAFAFRLPTAGTTDADRTGR